MSVLRNNESHVYDNKVVMCMSPEQNNACFEINLIERRRQLTYLIGANNI